MQGVLRTTQITVSASAVLLLPGNSARSTAAVSNTSGATIYIGQTSGVTSATGFPIPNAAFFSFPLPAYKGDIYMIGTSGLVGALETN